MAKQLPLGFLFIIKCVDDKRKSGFVSKAGIFYLGHFLLLAQIKIPALDTDSVFLL